MKEQAELSTLRNHTDKMFYDIVVASKNLKKRGFNPETQRARQIADRVDAMVETLFNDDNILAVLKEIRKANKEAETIALEDLDPVEMARITGYPGA